MRNERFANKRQIQEFLYRLGKHQGAGPVLWVEPGTKEVYVLDSESNAIFIGTSGSGKTRRGIVSMIRAWIIAKESFIVIDPKGDLRNLTWCFAKDAGYLLYSLNFRDLTHSDGINILEEPYLNYKRGNIEKCNDGIRTITEVLVKHSPHTDPFWPDSARTVIDAAIKILFKHGKPEEINMLSVVKIISTAFERIGSKKTIDIICEEEPNSPESLLLQNVRNTAQDTLGGILSVAFESLNAFVRNPSLTELLSSSDLSIGELDVRKQPVGIYIVTPDENENYSAIASILVSQITNHYIQLAHEKYDGRLERRVNICVEELGNLGENGIPNLDHLMSASRSRNCRIFLVLQSLSQLEQCYGKSRAETISSNADTIIAYRINQWDTLEELSKKCGERAIDYGKRVSVERLLEPCQINAFETGRVLVLSGRLKFSTVLPDFTTIFPMDNWCPPKDVKRKRLTIKVFDLKAQAKAILNKKEASSKMTCFNPFHTPLSKEEKANIDTTTIGHERTNEMIDSEEIDRIIAALDAEIAARDAEEKLKKDEERGAQSKTVDILVTCDKDENTIEKISRIINRHCKKISFASAKAVLRADSIIRVNVKRADAASFINAVNEAGVAATAWIDER